ncbi:MAG: polyribonucleotide nucleotidyltransferase [Candidatus Moranbacteria bacterium]|nr:polyribonucleotide nucleotidyltransferase [Candidatus Moranbacteria bacterium]
MKQEKKYNLELASKNYEIIVNKLAKQANGSVVVKCGETMVMATAVMSDKPNETIDYFPLFVEYEEHYWAAGKIRGSRFMKRKGRPTDEAILSGRLIDRSIRPLFPKGLKNEVQVVINVLSFDFTIDPRTLSFIAASIALETSDIPFNGPVAGVCIGQKNGELVINPTIDEQEQGGLSMFISGVKENIAMVEAEAVEVDEEKILKGMEMAQKANQKISQFVEKIAQENQVEKCQFETKSVDEKLIESLNQKYFNQFEEIFDNYVDKQDYEAKIKNLVETALEEELTPFLETEEHETMEKELKEILEDINKKVIQHNVLANKKRLGGRSMDEVREISVEVDYLPRTHGSAVFKRGETQSLTITTLGAPGSELILDGMADEPETTQRYMHFYSFPPYSTGQTGFFRGPGRREIGHGALGEKGLISMIPDKEKFPYTVIVNTEIMGSDGSTSMAGVCGSTLSLMDAGVPIKNPVSGVAMGLVVDEKDLNNYEVLTDLCANEDFAGHMDFKVAGTEKGITALQMDIKVQGLSLEILRDALKKAQKGRMDILKKMLETIKEPRKEVSKYAPRIEKIRINPDMIRKLIGPGGKNINAIIDQTQVQIDIEDDGLVYITSNDSESMDKAVELVQNATREPKVGETYIGKVTRILDFGAMVEFLPEIEGLVHISKLGRGQRVNRVRDVVDMGEKVKVKIDEIDRQGRFNLSFIEKVE